MSRQESRFSSRPLNIYVPLDDLRESRLIERHDGRRVWRWLINPAMKLFTCDYSSLWLSPEIARHANWVVMVNEQQFHPALNKKRFDAMVKWLLRWRCSGMLAETPLHILFYAIEKPYSVRFDYYGSAKAVWKEWCRVLPNGRLYYQERVPRALCKDTVESEKVIVTKDVVIQGDFWQINTLRFTPPASMSEPRNPYFESSFRSVQKRVVRQAELEGLEQARPAELPAIGSTRAVAEQRRVARPAQLVRLPALKPAAVGRGRPPLHP